MTSLNSMILVVMAILVNGIAVPTVAQNNLEYEPYRQRGIAIIKRIASASGTLNIRPSLIINESPGIAHFDLIARSVTVDPRLFMLADKHSTNPEAALAYVIGHEYAHYVRGHDFNYKYGHSFGEMLERSGNSEDSDARLAISRQAEFEADYYGLYFAYLAGYRYTLSDIGNFMDAMNMEFSGGRDISYTHPTWSARKLVVDTVLSEFDRMVATHYAGIALLLNDQFHSAAMLFEWINSTVPVPEVQWNEAMARLLALQKETGRDVIPKESLLLNVSYRPRFRGTGDVIHDRAWIDNHIDKCNSIIDALKFRNYQPDKIGHMQTAVSVMQESLDCTKCKKGSWCSDHSSKAKDVAEHFDTKASSSDESESNAATIEAQIRPVRTKLIALRRYMKTGGVKTSDGELHITTSKDANRISGAVEVASSNDRSTVVMLIEECKTCSDSTPALYDNKIVMTAEGQRLMFSIDAE